MPLRGTRGGEKGTADASGREVALSAARSQGRSHAVRLAQVDADVIAVDICRQIGFVPYPMGTQDDLAETARAVQAARRRVVAAVAAVRDGAGLGAAVELAGQNIRVNVICPPGVDTPQGHSAVLPGLLHQRPDLRPLFMNTLPVSHIQAEDVTAALLYLSGDDARYVTGPCLMLDAGATIR